ncbi:transmembrane amino acid transporter protein-domain-containing protein [Gautieria morchelliformis]|nr:transmembrane amino acid transporter protein-domain-containing protein [Gautieria morchelliformis]
MASSSHSQSADRQEGQSAAGMSPSRPVPIARPRISPQDELERTPHGTPDLRSLRAQFDPPPLDLPPRNLVAQSSSVTSPPVMSSSPMRTPLGRRDQGTPPPATVEELSDTEKAKVIGRHLVSRDERVYSNPGAEDPSLPGTSFGSAAGASNSIPRQGSEIFPIAYDVPGGDVTHDIYKWQADTVLRRTRSASYSGTQGNKHPAFEHIREPGGFRRNYLLLRAEDQESGDPEYGENGRTRMLNNFIDFLYIFGHFAGEDLEEEEEEEEEDEVDEAMLRANTLENGHPQSHAVGFSQSTTLVDAHVQPLATEQSPLLKHARGRSTSRRRHSRRLSCAAGEQHGDATVTQAVLMLLKSFIGTGVLFLGKAFMNGGLLFSTITLVFVAVISLWSFILLVRTKLVVSGSFGDIGGALYGTPMRFAILSSITISQIGFTAAYIIFVASNLQAFIMAITQCATYVSTLHLILAQLVVFLPLAMVRNLAKLSTTALIADAFILVGLVYIFSNEFALLASHGVSDIKLFNPKDYALMIGTAVFSFEGIGLVIPITDSMREPHKFPRVLTGVMIFLTVLFAGAGVLAYTAYGSNVQTVILLNLPQDQKFVQVVQFLYSMAILLSIPLQLFPAVRIMENGLFTRSGKLDPRVKWEKNAFRCVVVAACTLISWLGAADLDKFVAFVGSFACVPLCYVYPPMLHYKACARTKSQKVADIAMMFFGSVAAVFTTVQTIKLMMEPNGGSEPTFGNCPKPQGLF